MAGPSPPQRKRKVRSLYFTGPEFIAWLSSLSGGIPPTEAQRRMVDESNSVQLMAMKIPAWLFNWSVLGGFLFLPPVLSETVKTVVGPGTVYHAIQNIPVMVVGILMLSLGVVGDAVLWWMVDNLVWIKDNIFLPNIIHALFGLVTTLRNVYASKPPVWSTQAKVVTVISGLSMVVMSYLLVACSVYLHNHGG